MLEAAEYINTTITGTPEIASRLSGGLAWELAEEDVKVPFCTFSVVETPGRSKDAGGNYRVSFFIWTKTLTEGAQIADILKENLPGNFKFEMAQSGYTDGNAKEAYIETVFNFNL